MAKEKKKEKVKCKKCGDKKKGTWLNQPSKQTIDSAFDWSMLGLNSSRVAPGALVGVADANGLPLCPKEMTHAAKK